MNRPTLTAQGLRQAVTVGLPDLSVRRRICSYAQPFATFCEALVTHTSEHLTDEGVILALKHLQTIFFAWYSKAPAACLVHLTGKTGMICLLQLYKETYDQLFVLENTVMPPKLRTQDPAPQVEYRDIPGIPVGRIVKTEKA